MSDADILRDTTEFLHRAIPLTRSMDVRVAAYDGARLVLEAPLAPNHNHLGTAFGGSLSALATLAGYVLLWLALRDRSAHIVVQESSIRYRRPVRGDLQAVCLAPDSEELAAFLAEMAARGKARMRLRVEIIEAGQVAVEFEGTFVARS